MSQGPDGSAEEGLTKGPWTEVWEGSGTNMGIMQAQPWVGVEEGPLARL